MARGMNREGIMADNKLFDLRPRRVAAPAGRREVHRSLNRR
jgi:hypothetical protein